MHPCLEQKKENVSVENKDEGKKNERGKKKQFSDGKNDLFFTGCLRLNNGNKVCFKFKIKKKRK